MGCRKSRGIIFVFICIISFPVFSNDFYNSLVDDLKNACSYGYKGINLETGEIDFSNCTGDEGYIISHSETSFYIQSYKGFFRVQNDKNDFFYTRNGEFIKRGDDYYLAYANYKLSTRIKDCENNSSNKRTLIFHPTEKSKIIRNGNLFVFSDVECREEEIISNRLELPNIDSIKILLKMKSILNESSEKYQTQLEIINRMLDVLIDDKMHEYYTSRNYLQFDLEKYKLSNNQTNLDELRFLYSTNWARTFKEYIELLYI